MVEITGFLLKHLYELMADNYNSNFNYGHQSDQQQQQQQRRRANREENCHTTNTNSNNNQNSENRLQEFREQETNQQIVSFLTNNQLPDLACETFIELLFICVFLAISWVFVMIVQLHYTSSSLLQVSAGSTAPLTRHQHHHEHHQHQPAKSFYCQTAFINSLMYCNNLQANALAY